MLSISGWKFCLTDELVPPGHDHSKNQKHQFHVYQASSLVTCILHFDPSNTSLASLFKMMMTSQPSSFGGIITNIPSPNPLFINFIPSYRPITGPHASGIVGPLYVVDDIAVVLQFSASYKLNVPRCVKVCATAMKLSTYPEFTARIDCLISLAASCKPPAPSK